MSVTTFTTLDDQPEFLTRTQLADLLQISVFTIQKWRDRDEGPTWSKVGRHIRYPKSEVVEWIDQNRGRR